MRRLPWRTARPVRAAVLLLLSLVASCSTAEWIEYSDAPMPSAWTGWQESRTIVFRVVDMLGEPVAGAAATATYEREFPFAGELWHSGRAVSGRDGVVVLKVEGKCDLVNVRADGFADAADGPDGLEVVVLQRARPVPVRVVDWLGRPATGELGYTKFCGHRPDLEVASIGADGIAWLQRLGDDSRELYARCPGLGDEYVQVDARDGAPGHAPYRLRLFASPPIVGRVVGRDGQPLADVPIGGASIHRGPWTTSGADGTFRLEFTPPHDELELELPTEGKRRWLPAPPRAHACTLRVADAVADGETARTGTLRLRALRPDGSPVPDGVGLPGVALELEPDGGAGWRRARVVAGDHGLAIGGRLAGFESDEVAVTVVADATTEVTLRVRERPRVRIAVRGGATVRVELATAFGVVEVDPAEPIPVPCDGAAAFWIGRRAFPLPVDFATRGEPIELVPPTPTIVGRLLGEDGTPCRGTVTRGETTVATAADGTFALPAGVEGCDDPLVCRAADAPADGSARVLPLSLPPASDDRAYDVGDVRLWRRAPFSFSLVDGEVTTVSGTLIRAGVVVGPFSLGEDGDYEGPEPRAGDHVCVDWGSRARRDGEIARDLLLPLVGHGPWTLHEPSATIAFEVVDDAGAPVRAHLWYGRTGTMIDGERLASLARGTHRCLLTAEGHRSATVQVALADNEQRTLRVVLPRATAK